MTYYSDSRSHRVDLSGNEVAVSLVASYTMGGSYVDWFSDQTCNPFGQIEDLEVNGYSADMNNAFIFENLRVLRIDQWDRERGKWFLRLLHPDPVTGVPCRFLRRIECASPTFPESHLGSLTRLLRKRKQAGYQLELFCLSIEQEYDLDLVKELREHVGEFKSGSETRECRSIVISIPPRCSMGYSPVQMTQMINCRPLCTGGSTMSKMRSST